MAYQSVGDVQETFFKVPARRKTQKLIFFGRVESKPMICEDSESETELPQFSHYESNVLKMMENTGYDLLSDLGLNFDKRRRTLLQFFIPKGKILTIITKLRGGWAMCQLQSINR